MKYKIEIDKKAIKFINKQPQNQKIRILKAIYMLPTIGDIKAMKGNPDYFRLRVGDYRVIYNVIDDQLIVRVIEVGNRGDIYK